MFHFKTTLHKNPLVALLQPLYDKVVEDLVNDEKEAKVQQNLNKGFAKICVASCAKITDKSAKDHETRELLSACSLAKQEVFKQALLGGDVSSVHHSTFAKLFNNSKALVPQLPSGVLFKTSE